MSRSVRSLTTTTAALALTVALWPSDVQAQTRGTAQPRPPVVHSSVRVYRPYYYRPYYYSPYFYSPFYYGFSWGLGFGWGPYGPYPYGPYPYPYYHYNGHYNESSLRIQVKPNNAEVYIDGYYMGLVDSYDGMFQRLHLPPGEHEVEIFHEGYRSIRELMRFAPREGYELKRVMEPVAPGDPAPVRPKPNPAAQPAERETRDVYGRRPYPPDRVDEPGERPGAVRGAESGAVAIRVQPSGALVLIDGDKWEGPEGPDRLVIHLSEGTHRVEIQKEGYRPFVTEVRIRRGETVPLNISLRTGG
jgi:PEGA domain